MDGMHRVMLYLQSNEVFSSVELLNLSLGDAMTCRDNEESTARGPWQRSDDMLTDIDAIDVAIRALEVP